MRKLLISVDMEGVAGVASPKSLMPTGWEYHAYRKWMTNELNAVAQAAFDAGYDEVIATDGHGNAQNLDPDLLIDNINLVRGWPRPFVQMEMVDDPAVDACAFVGYHAAAGEADGVLAHTFIGAAFRSIRLNGEIASEGYFNAALAGAYDKPVIFVSGDQSTLNDAARYAPDAGMVATKTSIGFRAQMALTPAQVCQALGKAARDAFGKPLPKPFKIDPPYEVELEMTTHTAAQMLGYLPWVTRVDAWTIRAEFSSMADAMRFISFVTLFQATGQLIID